MSETVRYRGRIKKVVPAEGVSLQQHAEYTLKLRGKTVNKKNVLEELIDHFPEEFHYDRNSKELYEFLSYKKEDEYTDILEYWKNEDGSIDFFTQFYNGETCLPEVIDKIIEEVNQC